MKNTVAERGGRKSERPSPIKKKIKHGA